MGVFKHIKSAIYQGLFLTLPVIILILFVGWIINIFGDMSLIVSRSQKHPFLAILIFLILSYLCGLFLNSKFAQKRDLVYIILLQIPLIGPFTARFIGASQNMREASQVPILIQHPRLNCWSIGFIMGAPQNGLIRVLVFTGHIAAQNCWFSEKEEVKTGYNRSRINEFIVSYGFLGKKENVILETKTLGEIAKIIFQ